ncbi:jacalin-like lectin domain protein (macronuclear) [Tetrahymena thermophila SB210]|uniref:Jacalin-like lectin domain protein n=1 Tax=Tetrahymena thermophila (strain SB210) TaxID=312017 RepID=Q231V2_TETTS|nr:jacalin-like lectin domain protein [Tetrahymena thermophila SB210]EAR91348.1 jacalin-like lectin domain protein [Tetrahymena thermophila SB210]|eukprot:XP_001011593.1 jacalin-like lectin domain protein [Tetrahymena thermophila SB210]
MFGKIGNFFNKVQVKTDAFFQAHHSNQHHHTHSQQPPHQGQYPPPPEMQAQYPPHQQQGQYPPPPPDMHAQQCSFPSQQQGSFPPPPPFADQFQPQQFGCQNQNPYYNDKRKSVFKKFSKKAGKDNHQNSNYFDHLEQSSLKNSFHTPEVKRITVFHNNNIVVGIEVTYSTLGNQNAATISSKGTSCYGFVQSSSIELSFGERIEEISGRAGDSIDRIKIKTNKNQVLEVGGFGGQPFNFILVGYHPTVISFGGSTREYLDSIYVIYK